MKILPSEWVRHLLLIQPVVNYSTIDYLLKVLSNITKLLHNRGSIPAIKTLFSLGILTCSLIKLLPFVAAKIQSSKQRKQR